MPRTCVSLPFIWFARTMTWRMYACIGLLESKVCYCIHYDLGRGKDVQPLAVVAWLGRDVERDPPVGTFERDRAHLLQVTKARAGAHRERRGRVGVVELVAQVEAEFLSSLVVVLLCKGDSGLGLRHRTWYMRYLNCHLARKLDGYEVRLGAIRAEEEAVGRELGAFGCVEWELRTDCQNVSASWSCRHSGPNPNLNEDTDHFARWPMSGHGSTGGLLTVFQVQK